MKRNKTPATSILRTECPGSTAVPSVYTACVTTPAFLAAAASHENREPCIDWQLVDSPTSQTVVINYRHLCRHICPNPGIPYQGVAILPTTEEPDHL
mmetsp:Transcript_7792/g.9735  ORF Transcript_7792/g.9735 Transcript_7792/m.9735 type:complete len:97 (-) Transcript_7792:220-510(-)